MNYNTDKDTLATSSQKGRFTLAETDEKKRQEILKTLSAGIGIVKCAKDLGVSTHTVEAVRDHELANCPRFANAYYQSRLPAKLLNIASKGLDVIGEKLETMPAAALGVTVGIAIDKYLAISGQATSVIEHRHTLSMGDAYSPGQVIDI